jgi:acyl-CoA thioesterase-2
MHPGAYRVYGGQVLAQAVSAAVSTVDEGRTIHSQHAYFLRPGDASTDIEYQVERARDGGSFSSRRVVALQRGKPILVSSMSFQQASRSDEYQPPMPEVAEPEDLVTDRQQALATSTLDQDFRPGRAIMYPSRLAEPDAADAAFTGLGEDQRQSR